MKTLSILSIVVLLFTSCSNDSIEGNWVAGDPFNEEGFLSASDIENKGVPIEKTTFETIKKQGASDNDYKKERTRLISIYRGSKLDIKADSTFEWTMWNDYSNKSVTLKGKYRNNQFNTRTYFEFDKPYEKGDLSVIYRIETRLEVTNGRKLNVVIIPPNSKVHQILKMNRE
jgi:hypothetical protein